MIFEYFSTILLISGIFFGIACAFAGLACYFIYITKDE